MELRKSLVIATVSLLYVLSSWGLAPLEDNLSSKEQSIKQWKTFRANESKYTGTKVHWRVKVWLFTSFTNTVIFSKEWPQKHKTVLVDKDGSDITSGNDNFPSLHEGDWITVTGSFAGISDLGEVKIKCTKIVNEGPDEEELE